MDNSHNCNCSSSSSSCINSTNSTNFSNMDIKIKKSAAVNETQQQQQQQKLSTSRSRSFLHCLSKRLGRHFLIHHQNQHQHRRNQYCDTNLYNSQDDIRSSSTDSFSLSFERGSNLNGPSGNNGIDVEADGNGGGGSSSCDLNSTDERTSRVSSVSAYSRFSPTICTLDADDLDAYEQQIYMEALYRPSSCTPTQSNLDADDSDSDEDNDKENNAAVHVLSSEEDEHNVVVGANDENIYNNMQHSMHSSSTLSTKGLHLSRISITSSVSRMLQHFSATAATTRSLSCSSTPLRRFTKHTVKAKKSNASSSTPATTPTENVKNNNSNKKSVSSSNSRSSSNSGNNKKDKKQQSILRPPIHYVYMKGMSGLYSRVPRYTVCCPYAMQQIA